jgi:hypothetical protein
VAVVICLHFCLVFKFLLVTGLQLHYVHGYRGFDTHNSAQYTSRGMLVFHAAAAGIVMNPTTNEQVLCGWIFFVINF